MVIGGERLYNISPKSPRPQKNIQLFSIVAQICPHRPQEEEKKNFEIGTCVSQQLLDKEIKRKPSANVQIG